ncbi:hypothetical protein JOF43_000977 [Brachybacterium sacelli]|uniref:Uncharacterized protein n=1 Tax=Brachybacterium sacelli TaxID=173364 RepID=A0ABS4WXT8_9MICO|nr:hypothetical protein [Brachybacterium sacelli]
MPSELTLPASATPVTPFPERPASGSEVARS